MQYKIGFVVTKKKFVSIISLFLRLRKTNRQLIEVLNFCFFK